MMNTIRSFAARCRSKAATHIIAGVLASAAPALALEEQPGDAAALKDCEKRLCTQILTPEIRGDDLKCNLAKSWPKTTLKGGESKLVKWGFGDARCEVDLEIGRDLLHRSLTEPNFSLEVPEHKVRCEVESDGEMKKVRVALAPRIEFKDGKAHKVWINLKDVTGPSSIKATVWAAANLEDSLGVFHKSMIKSINKFMFKQCAERHGPGAQTAEQPSTGVKVAKGADAQEDSSTEPAETTKPAGPTTTAAPPPAPAPAPAPAASAPPSAAAKPAAPEAAPSKTPSITLKFRNAAPWTIRAGE